MFIIHNLLNGNDKAEENVYPFMNNLPAGMAGDGGEGPGKTATRGCR